MTPEEKQAMQDSIELAVQKGNEPIWTKLRDHDTQLALHQQDLDHNQRSSVAQGERLGTIETKVDKHSLFWKVFWIGLTGLIAFMGWLIGKVLMFTGE